MRKRLIEQRDIPQYFMERCERIDEFVKQVNNVYELFKVDMSWKNKMGESRGLISQQLDGLSNVISNLALEINNDIEFKGDLEERLLSEFENAGVKVKDILVYKNKWEKFEVNIFHKGCAGSNKCLDSIEKMASSVLKRRMIKTEANACTTTNWGHAILNWWRRKFSASLQELLEGKSMTVGYPGIIIPL